MDDGEYLKISEAVLRIFDRQEYLRANRARARIKFLIDKVGIEEFRRMVDEELEGDWVNERDFNPDPLLFVDDEQAKAPGPPSDFGSANGDASEFAAFAASNVQAQRQEGFSTVEVKVTRGDLTPEQFRGLAQIMRDFTGGYARTTVHQNFLLRWVRDESVYDVWQRLKELDLGDAGAHQITDVVSCPGTDSCKLGITSSMGLNQAVQQRLEEMQIEDPLTRADPREDERLPQRMLTAPHREHRLLRRGDEGRRPPDARLHRAPRRQLRGRRGRDGQAPEGAHPGQARARRRRALGPPLRAEPQRRRAVFNDFVERVGQDEFEALVKDLSLPVEFTPEHITHFIDWNRKDLYEVVRGEGECAV